MVTVKFPLVEAIIIADTDFIVIASVKGPVPLELSPATRNV